MAKVLIIKSHWKMLNGADEADCEKSFIIHTATAAKMDGFVEKLNEIATSLKFEHDLVHPLTYKYQTRVGNSIEKCDWVGMPEMAVNPDILRIPEIRVHYKLTSEQFQVLQTLMKEKLQIKLTLKSKSFWYPERMPSLKKNYDKYWVDTVKPKYPIYIISKGRWERRYTSKYLEWAGLDYKIVIEPQEYENYAAVIDPSKIIILPAEYLNHNRGGIPARNFVLHHSRANGDYRHWILDDNIKMYSRHYNNERIIVCGGSAFRTVEDYADRYTNVKLCGHQYKMFVPPTQMSTKAYTLNTRVYSSMLIRNDIEFEWRGKYNEDVDLSLQVLKNGDPTLLFNCFLADKEETLIQKGGNTDSIYLADGVKAKAEALQAQHPDVAKVVTRYGRIHHQVNYHPFKKNPLIKKEVLDDEVDYKLELKLITDLPKFWRGNS